MSKEVLDGFPPSPGALPRSSVEIGILKVELFLGIFIGAVTFTGSVIAYGKLAGLKVTSRSTPRPSCRAGIC